MKNWSATVKVFISIALVVVLVVTADVKEIAATVVNFHLPWLLPVLFFIFFAVVISSFKWQALLGAQGMLIPFGKLFQYYTAGFFFNNFLPSSIGCDGVRVLLLKNEFKSYAGAASSVVMERILAAITLALIGLAGSFFAAAPERFAVIALAAVFAAGVILMLVLLTGFVPKSLAARAREISPAETPAKFSGKLAKFALGWKNFACASVDLRKHPASLALCLVGSIAFQVTVALSQQMIVFGLHLSPIPWGDLFFVSAAASVLAMIPLGVNGYGFREGGFIYLLAPLGYTSSEAFTISILFALFVSVYSLLGAVFWVSCQRRQTRQTAQEGLPNET
ncbi:MAG: flippase-like domain-containing protein [Spirochaetaceae bacterium]|nr:flippase-like domain-containing protein [Spirochaetaceae bacterium]